MDGTVARLRSNGYGFVTPSSGEKKDVFFHAQSLRDITFDELREGDIVGFEIVEGPKGPVAINLRRDGDVSDWEYWAASEYYNESPNAHIVIEHAVEVFKTLTPELLSHLRQRSEDVELVSPSVFEHLIGELLAGSGWSDVRLVGRNSQTQADIFAMHYLPPSSEVPIRLFVEAKRWKDRIGVEVINQVLGAMFSERDRLGWHAAMIVTIAGVKNTRRFDQDDYRKKGIEVRDKNDVFRWLKEYKCSPDGLWVPPVFNRSLP